MTLGGVSAPPNSEWGAPTRSSGAGRERYAAATRTQRPPHAARGSTGRASQVQWNGQGFAKGSA